MMLCPSQASQSLERCYQRFFTARLHTILCCSSLYLMVLALKMVPESCFRPTFICGEVNRRLFLACLTTHLSSLFEVKLFLPLPRLSLMPWVAWYLEIVFLTVFTWTSSFLAICPNSSLFFQRKIMFHRCSSLSLNLPTTRCNNQISLSLQKIMFKLLSKANWSTGVCLKSKFQLILQRLCLSSLQYLG